MIEKTTKGHAYIVKVSGEALAASIKIFVLNAIIFTLFLCPNRPAWAGTALVGEWSFLASQDVPEPREEAGLVACNGKLYLLGGRGNLPIDILDPKTGLWSRGTSPPYEIHHFQPVAIGRKIYVVGAMSGPFPREKAIPNILIYDTVKNEWNAGPAMPPRRLRGAAGTVVSHGKIYLVGGIVDGHWTGNVAWFDEFDPRRQAWRSLPSAPRARDHFQAVVIGDKLYAAGGRRSSGITNQVFDLTIAAVDVYDFQRGRWRTLSHSLPTPRAGAMNVVSDGNLIVIGGESMSRSDAHTEVESFNTKTGIWIKLPSLQQGRHGTGAAIIQGQIFVSSGSGGRGGAPVLTTTETTTLHNMHTVKQSHWRP